MRCIAGLLGLFTAAAGAVLLHSTPARAATVTVGPNREVLVDGQPFLPIMQCGCATVGAEGDGWLHAGAGVATIGLLGTALGRRRRRR